MKKVSIIILNFNGSRFIEELMFSLAKQTYNNFEIIFVDNASTDNSLEILSNVLKEIDDNKFDVNLIVNNENLGFCRGNNVGLKYATGDFVVFLNNDTFVDSKWLEELVRVLKIYPEVGACQSKIVDANTNILQNMGLSFNIYGWPSPNCNLKNFDDRDDVLIDSLFYPSGASVIIRKEILDKCGGFDMNLFYGDYDLGWRIRLLGYKISVNLRSICYHFGSYTIKSLFSHIDRTYESIRERIYVMFKNYSLSKVMTRLSISVAIMFFLYTYLTLKYRKPYVISLMKALFWNIKKINLTILERGKIQSTRVSSDFEIEVHMCAPKFSLTLNNS